MWSVLLLIATAGGTTDRARAQVALGSKPEQLLYIAIKTDDMENARRFYTGVIGLKELPGSDPRSAMLSFSGNFEDSFLMIVRDDGGARPRKPGTLRRLVFKVLDAKAVVERARASKASIKREAAPAHGMPGLIVATILDPDGNEIELVQAAPK